ncbi:MAG: hypothetical protein JXQ80_12195 [Bacteroidales bacterium]|nr:hypothetical protein [Bacteroidales bacterium]
MKAAIEKYFVSEKGVYSSTRLFSYFLLKFFIVFNVITLLLITYLFIAVGKSGINENLLLIAGGYWIAFNILLAFMIFVPKQLNKVNEITKIIEMTRNAKSSDNEA